MDMDQVCALFARLAGLSGEAAAQWRPLCETAAAGLAARLRPDADPLDPRLALAAAGVAYCRYALSRGEEGESVRVGEISVSGRAAGAGAQSARALRDELLADAAPLLEQPAWGIRRVD